MKICGPHSSLKLGLALLLASSCAALTDPPKLEAVEPLELACDTKAVVVATDAANASSGRIRLSLQLDAGQSSPMSGRWHIAGADEAHTGAFAATQRTGCSSGCPLTFSASGDAQLWSPAPKAVNQLAEGEVLLLAVVKPETLRLRATTFRGQQIEALEEGECRKAD